MLSRRRCCCGGGGCFNCAPCTACGGFHACDISASDDNGSFTLAYKLDNPAGNAWWYSPILSVASSQCRNALQTGVQSGTALYQYIVRCNGSAIEVGFVTGLVDAVAETADPLRECLCPPAFACWLCGTLPSVSWGWVPLSLSSCDPPTGTASWPATGVQANVWSSCPDFTPPCILTSLPLTPPSAGISLTFNLESPHPGACCCLPCALPKTHLTLTIPGGSTVLLSYQGGNSCTWLGPCVDNGDDTSYRYQLGCSYFIDPHNTFIALNRLDDTTDSVCSPGTMAATGIGTVQASSTCSPLHLDFFTGSVHYYVDA